MGWSTSRRTCEKWEFEQRKPTRCEYSIRTLLDNFTWRTLALLHSFISGILLAQIVAHLTYQKWKQLLRKDCSARGKLGAFRTLDEIVLNILYENGIEPTVDALINKGMPGPDKKSATQSQPGDSQGQPGD